LNLDGVLLVQSDFEADIKQVLSTEVGQNTENTTDTVHISLLIWHWTTFCIQHNRNPSWNGFVQVSNSGILYHHSSRTSSGSFIDVVGNLFLILVSRADQNGSVMFKSGDCAGQGRY
jgi:hypothetical protein